MIGHLKIIVLKVFYESVCRLSKVADDLNLQLSPAIQNIRKWQERKAFESVDNDSPLIVLKEVAEISRVLQHVLRR